MPKNTWDEETDVVVVGYGGAGAIAAIAAHDAGARVLIVEKQPADTPTKTNHTPSTRMSGGWWLCPGDQEKAVQYIEGLGRIANETLTDEYREVIRIFAQYLVENTDWMAKIGVKLLDEVPVQFGYSQSFPVPGLRGRRRGLVDFPNLPGAEYAFTSGPAAIGNYRLGPALFKTLYDAIDSRGIPVMWESPAEHLITGNEEVRGVVARHGNKEIRLRASRAVILTCGGFEFNEWMKQNYLRLNPVHFYGNPGNTGDGIKMVMEVGAALWHMNAAPTRAVMKFPDFPVAFGTQRHETDSIIVDRRGKRFSNECFNLHAFGYELANYDSYAMGYPRVPCYWIFDEKRRTIAPLASHNGACNPPGGVMGDIFYIWDEDNRKEIDRGWIMRANSLEDLAKQIRNDQDNGELLNPSALQATIKQYNEYCRKGEDKEFHKPKQWLHPLEDPPYYAMKLWPGGPNTQGGPKRNARAQVLRVNNCPIPRLYAAGELGSVWGMLYQGGGNIGECIAFGRIAGANAAAEKPWK